MNLKMAWYPKAIKKPITVDKGRLPMVRPVRINYHTAVTSASSLFSYFNVRGRSDSHFYVRDDGTVEQMVDTAMRANADLQGNPDTISIETWDGWGSSSSSFTRGRYHLDWLGWLRIRQ